MAYQTSEIGNDLPRRAILRVTPTIPEAEVAQHEVLFLTTEIPNAVAYNGGCSKLAAVTVVDGNDKPLDLDIVFMEVGSYELGPLNGAVNISRDNIINAKMIGVCTSDNSANSTDLINGIIQTTSGGNQTATTESGLPMFWQTASGTTSIYFSAIMRSATVTFTNAAQLQFYFHVEY